MQKRAEVVVVKITQATGSVEKVKICQIFYFNNLFFVDIIYNGSWMEQ